MCSVCRVMCLVKISQGGCSKLSSGFSGTWPDKVHLPCDLRARGQMDNEQVNQSAGRVDAESEKKCCEIIKQKR